ncbi:hypothetical protein EDB19DRAFT_1299265 [Suillus lakei]|nr:hypothetical protein EDB19DRAFT_1299265 [Suillus lakei]
MSCPELAAGMEDTMDISIAPLSRGNRLTRFKFSVTFDESGILVITLNNLPQLEITLRVNGWWQNIHMLYSWVIAPLCLFRNLEHLDITISGRVSEGRRLAGLQTFPYLQKLTLSNDRHFAVGFLTVLQSTVLHTLDVTLIMECIPSAGDRPESLGRHRLSSSLRHLTISSGFRFMTSLIEAIHSSALESLSLTIVNTYESDKPIARALATDGDHP